MNFLIVTGMSGAGKSTAVEVLEDIGYYCIDNIPPMLIPKFLELCLHSSHRLDKLAMVVDVRGRELFAGLTESLASLNRQRIGYRILFLDAADEVLQLRFKETRRKHPMLGGQVGELSQAIEKERGLLGQLRQAADYYIDTSKLSVAQLREQISDIFLRDKADGMLITCMSFGFKYGLPSDADTVFDVRCLPNPFYLPELREKTGLDGEVYNYVMDSPVSQEFAQKISAMMDFLIPHYQAEGKSQLVIAVGCTGGKHRSVTFARYLYDHLKSRGNNVVIAHRDLQKH